MTQLRFFTALSDSRYAPLVSDSLLVTKMLPPDVQPCHTRQRLFEQLDEPASLTMLVTPPGSGKTTLLADWIQKRRISAGWLTLDSHDDDPYRFASYVCAAMSVYPQPDSAEGMLVSLMNEIVASNQPQVLILDNFHTVTNRKTHQLVNFLLQHQPGNLRLIIASRTLPPLALARLRVQGKLRLLRTSDLAFTMDEAIEFVYASQVKTAVERSLLHYVHGWAAGLRLLVLAHQEGRSQLECADLTRQYLWEYVAQEVLKTQPPDIQSFLLRTAALRHLTPALCDSATGRSDSRAVLHALQSCNLFIQRIDDQGFSYLPFFREALQAHLVLTPQHDSAQTAARSTDHSPIIELPGVATPLSEREREVLALLADGHSSPEIARQMIIAVSTVKTHIKHIYRKLEVDNRHQALKRAQELNLIQIQLEDRFRHMLR